MIKVLDKKATKNIEKMQDISQYFSIMNGASVANTNIGFYKNRGGGRMKI